LLLHEILTSREAEFPQRPSSPFASSHGATAERKLVKTANFGSVLTFTLSCTFSKSAVKKHSRQEAQQPQIDDDDDDDDDRK